MIQFVLAKVDVESLLFLAGEIALYLAIAVIALRVLRKLKGRFLAGERSRQQASLISIGDSGAKIAVWALTTIFILGALGVSLTPILAGLGIAGISVGFGMQSLFKDLISGLFLLAEGNLEIGDRVKIGSIFGEVSHLSLRSVRIRSPEGDTHTIPYGGISIVTSSEREGIRHDV